MPSSHRLILKTSAAGLEKQLWTIADSGRTVLRATIQWLPDDSLDVHGIETAENPCAVELEAAARLLLTRATRFATGRNLRFTRLVDWSVDGILPAAAFEQSGFKIGGVIHEWTRNSAPSNSFPPDSHVRRVSLKPNTACAASRSNSFPAIGLTTATERDLMELITDCVTDSEDLRGLPAPVPQLVFNGWKALPGSVDIIVADEDSRDVAMAVVSRSAADQPLILEYLGVASSARRQGHATRLIHAIVSACFCDDVKSDEAFSSRAVPGIANPGIIAFCDSANTIAIDIYRRHGFTRGQAGTIYIRLI